jgi:serine/threonine-protein kinase
MASSSTGTPPSAGPGAGMSLIAELKRRKVFKVGAAYLVIAWLAVQAASIAFPTFEAPLWALRVFILVCLLGFPIAVVMAWVFDATPEGVKFDGNVSGNKRVFAGAAVLVVLALGWYFYGQPAFRKGDVTKPTAIAAPAVAAAPEKSIAVLPFVDMSEGKDQEYFSDGLSEQLLNALAQLPELHVAGRTSSFYFKGHNEDLREIGRKLNVATVLEGSVAKSGDTLRVTAQLINAEDGYHLWSQTYDRPFHDVFALQDEIAGNVVAALKLKLLPGHAPATPRSSSPESYDQYLLGLALMRQTSLDGWNRAIAAFGRAVALDPGFAPALAGLAEAEYEVSYNNTDATGVIAAQARALQRAERAIAIAPTLADGYRTRGRLRSESAFDQSGAMADFTRALELNPGDSGSQQKLGDLLRCLGRFDEGQAALDKALDLDPLSVPAMVSLANLYKSRGDFAQAERYFERALQLSPDSSYALEGLGETLLMEGKLPQALATTQRQPDEARRLYVTAMVQHSLGDRAQSDQALHELERRFGAGWAFQVGAAYAWRGERDKAFAWLERSYRQQDGGLLLTKTDRLLAGLRSDPRFPALLRKVGLEP